MSTTKADVADDVVSKITTPNNNGRLIEKSSSSTSDSAESNELSLSSLSTSSSSPDSKLSSSPVINLQHDDDQLQQQQQQQCLLTTHPFVSLKSKVGPISDANDFETLISELLVSSCSGGGGSGGGRVGTDGFFSKVLHRPSGVVMTRKVINFEMKPGLRAQITKELSILHEFNSEYLIGFYDGIYYKGEISLYMEYIDVGSLDFVLSKYGQIPELILGKITEAVLNGILYLRDKHDLITWDIQPSNIYINSIGQIKLSHLGVSSRLFEAMKKPCWIGNKSYMSPERLQGSRYSPSSDIWSLGLTLIELATGNYPFPPPCSDSDLSNGSSTVAAGSRLTIFELLNCIVNGPCPSLPSPNSFSPEFDNFVSACLVKNPVERPDLTWLMNHAWIKKCVVEAEDIRDWIQNTIKIGIPSIVVTEYQDVSQDKHSCSSRRRKNKKKHGCAHS